MLAFTQRLNVISELLTSRLFFNYVTRLKKHDGPKSINPCPSLKDRKRTTYMNLDGKCVLITDGSKRIGFVTASELLKSNAANVIITGSNSTEGKDAVKALNNRYGKDRATYFQMDAKLDKQYEDTFKFIKLYFQQLDIMFNYCEIPNPKDHCMIDISLASQLRGITLARKYMKSGVIINHTSSLGLNQSSNSQQYESVAAAKIIAASTELSNQQDKNNTNPPLRVITLCSEPIYKSYFDCNEENVNQTRHQDNMTNPFVIAKAVSYTVVYAPNGTIWRVQKNGMLQAIEPDYFLYGFV